MENLLASWQEFLSGKKKRKDVAEFSISLMDNILALHQELVHKIYRHGPYQAFKINDPKPRDIHKASVRDRLVHHALYRILLPYFDRRFIHDSYSCRHKKGMHRALNRFRDFMRKISHNNTRTCWVLKCDIRKFFANIDHKILLNILYSSKVLDGGTLWLLQNVIESFPAGLPLGNLTSQLLVNIYMNEFDQWVKRELKIKYYIRYADDFVLMNESRLYLEGLLPRISEFLQNKLSLSLNPAKVSIATSASGVDFLGWVHFPYHRTLRASTKRRMFRNLAQSRTEGRLVSYRGLLSHGNTHKIIQAAGLDRKSLLK